MADLEHDLRSLLLATPLRKQKLQKFNIYQVVPLLEGQFLFLLSVFSKATLTGSNRGFGK
jgi:hypothetical protein